MICPQICVEELVLPELLVLSACNLYVFLLYSWCYFGGLVSTLLQRWQGFPPCMLTSLSWEPLGKGPYHAS